MAIEVDFVDGPAFLAPVLVNGDETGIRPEDEIILNDFINNLPNGYYVVSTTDDEPWCGRWNGMLYEMCTYILHKIN